MTENIFDYRAQILEEVFGNTRYKSDSKEVFIFCPNGCNDRKRKLQINVRKNAGQCWICGGLPDGNKGSIFSILKKYATKSEYQSYIETIDFDSEMVDFNLEEVENIDYPESFSLLVKNKKSPLGRLAYEHLKPLNLSDDVLLWNKVGICEYGDYEGMLVFPSYGEKGDLNFFTTRALHDSALVKYKSPPAPKRAIIFNEIFIDWNKPIILVENVKSYLRHNSMQNVVPILGSNLNESYKVFQSIVMNTVPEVILALDEEAEDKAVEICNLFDSFGVENKLAPIKGQPDEMTTREFINCIDNARKPNVDLLDLKIRSLL